MNRGVILGLCVMLTRYASALECRSDVTAREALEHADAAFVGRVVAIRPRQGLTEVRLRADRHWKGMPHGVRKVRTDMGGFGYRFIQGGTYVIFARRQKDGYLWVDLCGGTRPLKEARPLVDELDKIAAR